MHLESGRQLGESRLVFNGGQGYFGLEFRTVISAFPAHGQILSFGLTQSLTHCPVFGGHRPPLNEISQLGKFIETYYKMPTMKLSTDGDCLMQIAPIDENNYFKSSSILSWKPILQKQLAHIMVEYFFDKDSRQFLRKCEECKKFYVSKSMAHSKYCSDRCRNAFHNRKRIESGQHREYKRKKRLEGAKESYYG